MPTGKPIDWSRTNWSETSSVIAVRMGLHIHTVIAARHRNAPQTTFRKRSILERFFERIRFNGDCWCWTGRLDTGGYGKFGSKNGSAERAHRASFKLFIGEIPNGKIICHRCNNPACVNPKHLYAGTSSDNTNDAVRAGRMYTSSKLTPNQVIEIKERLKNWKWGMCGKLAKEFGVSLNAIKCIKSNRQWKYVNEAKIYLESRRNKDKSQGTTQVKHET